jgi:hypothetical protein
LVLHAVERYVGPGHTPRLYAGTEVGAFRPTAERAKTMVVVVRNAERRRLT